MKQQVSQSINDESVEADMAISGNTGAGNNEQVTPAFRFSELDSAGYSSFQGYEQGSKRIFENHALQPQNKVPVLIEQRNPDWFTIVLLLIISGLTWIRVFYYKIFRQLFAAFLSNLVSNQVVRDENILVQRASILLSFIFYLTASLFVYQISVYFEWNYPVLGSGFTRFIIIALVISFAYSFKMVLLKALGEIFKIDKQVATYIFNIFLINNVLGLMLIPVVVSIAYVVTATVGWVITIGISLVIISFIYRSMRAFRIWASMHNVSFFYLFLYFCTLEIAPILIIIKIAGV